MICPTLFSPYLPRDVLDDLVPAVLAEVDIEVRHRHALGVEEALEEQVVRDGIQVRDPQRVGHERARARATSRPHRDVGPLGPVDEVLDDEEVAAEPHLLDDAKLQVEAGAVDVRVELRAGLVQFLEALVEALEGQLRHEAVRGVAVGHLEGGQHGLAELELQVALLGDALRVVDGLGGVLEELQHLLGAGDVELVRGVPHALAVRQRLAAGDAHEQLMRPRVLALDVVRVRGGAQGDVQVPAERLEVLVGLVLLGQAVGLDLEEEVAGLEDVLVLERRLAGVVHVPAEARAGDFTAQARGEREEALAVLGQELLVDARVVVEAVHVRPGGQDAQVGVALGVLGDEDEVVGDLLGAVLAALGAGDVGLHADDGLDAGVLRLLVEVDGGEHVAVIGHGHARHPLLLHRLDEVLHPDGAIQEGVQGVQVEVGKGHGGVGGRARSGGEQ